MTQSNRDRIIAISRELGLSHIGSNVSCLPVLEEIYANKKPEDIVILDNAHAHLAHLVVQYSEVEQSPEAIPRAKIRKFGIHCDRQAGCDASGGSLGHGLGIGIGYALTDRSRDVYVIVSDGSMQEGSNWEALRLANDLHIENLHIHCNFNSYTAVAKIDPREFYNRMISFYPDIKVHYTTNTEEFDGVGGHYKVLEK